MVTDDVGEIGLLHAALEGDEVEEALIAFRVFRACHHGKHGVELLAYEDGVFHLALGRAGVDVTALDVDFGAGGVEVLKLQFSNFAAVHGVCVLCAEAFNVEFHYAAADFFVRGEPDLDGAVLEFRVLHYVLDGVHDFGHAGFVVCAKKGGAVRGDEGLAHEMKHFRELGGLQEQAGNALQGDFSAVVVLYDLRLHIIAGGVRGGVHVGDEAYGRAGGVAGNACHHIAVFVKGGLHSHGLEFGLEHLQKVPFFCGRRLGF